jgi:predicted enzyme related to lactoylglutathione lyase
MKTLYTICWTDIPVTDLNRAAAFYGAVLAQDIQVIKEGDMEMAMYYSGEEHGNFCLAETEDRQPGSSGPLIYLSAEGRLDDAISKVEMSGGKVLQGKHQIGPYGFRALITDSEGNGIALHSMKE